MQRGSKPKAPLTSSKMHQDKAQLISNRQLHILG